MDEKKIAKEIAKEFSAAGDFDVRVRLTRVEKTEIVVSAIIKPIPDEKVVNAIRSRVARPLNVALEKMGWTLTSNYNPSTWNPIYGPNFVQLDYRAWPGFTSTPKMVALAMADILKKKI